MRADDSKWPFIPPGCQRFSKTRTRHDHWNVARSEGSRAIAPCHLRIFGGDRTKIRSPRWSRRFASVDNDAIDSDDFAASLDGMVSTSSGNGVEDLAGGTASCPCWL